jgi:hypothetical protein
MFRGASPKDWRGSLSEAFQLPDSRQFGSLRMNWMRMTCRVLVAVPPVLGALGLGACVKPSTTAPVKPAVEPKPAHVATYLPMPGSGCATPECEMEDLKNTALNRPIVIHMGKVCVDEGLKQALSDVLDRSTVREKVEEWCVTNLARGTGLSVEAATAAIDTRVNQWFDAMNNGHDLPEETAFIGERASNVPGDYAGMTASLAAQAAHATDSLQAGGTSRQEEPSSGPSTSTLADAQGTRMGDAIDFDIAEGQRKDITRTVLGDTDSCARMAVQAELIGAHVRSRAAIHAFADDHCAQEIIHDRGVIDPQLRTPQAAKAQAAAMVDNWIDTVSENGRD